MRTEDEIRQAWNRSGEIIDLIHVSDEIDESIDIERAHGFGVIHGKFDALDWVLGYSDELFKDE